jgi:hypothetical protein
MVHYDHSYSFHVFISCWAGVALPGFFPRLEFALLLVLGCGSLCCDAARGPRQDELRDAERDGCSAWRKHTLLV